MSARPDEILERYRDAQSLDEAHRARLLYAIQSRIAGGSGGSGNNPSAGSPGASPALAKVTALLPKLVLGFALAGGSTAWLASRTSPRDATIARPPIVLTRTHASASNLEPEPFHETTQALDPASRQETTQASGRTHAPESVSPSDLPPAPALAHAATPTRLRAPTGRRPTQTPTPAEDIASVSSPTELLPSPGAGQAALTPERVVAPAMPASPAEPPAPTNASVVDEEVRLVAQAYSFLRDGNPAKALAAVEEHERRFPNGQLVESRRVTRILALCQLGRTDEGRAERGRFLALYPRSPFSNRVRAACADTGAP